MMWTIPLFLCIGSAVAPPDPLTTLPSTASQPTSDQSPVAMVLGRTIHRWEIEVPTAEREKYRSSWKPEVYEKWLMDQPGRRLFSRVGGALMQKFMVDNHLQATPREISELNDALARLGSLRIEKKKQRIKRIQQELNQIGLSEKERADLEKDLQSSQRSIEINENIAKRKHTLPPSEQPARSFVESWKINRALYAKYGGRIIWQQAGIEPLEAMQKWLEEQERTGAFEIVDPKLRDSFYGYFHLQHTNVKQENAFDKPWWLKEPDKEQDIRFGKQRVPPIPLPETAPADATPPSSPSP